MEIRDRITELRRVPASELQDNPKNWRSGFCVLTFDDYLLLPPELVMVRDFREGEVMFRGEIVKVSLPDPVSIH